MLGCQGEDELPCLVFLESQEVREVTERHGGGQESHALRTRLVTVLGKAQLQRRRCPWHRSSLPSGRGSGPSPCVPRSAARAERHAIATSRSAAPREASAQLRAVCTALARTRVQSSGARTAAMDDRQRRTPGKLTAFTTPVRHQETRLHVRTSDHTPLSGLSAGPAPGIPG